MLGMILIFWCGNFFFSIPAKISDRAITEGWAQDSGRFKSELTNSRLLSLLYSIPTISLFVLTIKSYRRRNDKLFFKTFLFGLTLFQIIPTFGLFRVTEADPDLFRPILAVLFILFLVGQVISIYKLYELRHSNHNMAE